MSARSAGLLTARLAEKIGEQLGLLPRSEIGSNDGVRVRLLVPTK